MQSKSAPTPDPVIDEQSVRVPAVDRLTGVATTAALRARMAHVQREVDDDPDGITFGLVLVNIRDLSAFNQAHGYDQGDRLIAAAAGRLKLLTAAQPGVERSTTVECIARTGGGEFVLLARTRVGELSQFRRWLRLALHERPLVVDGQAQDVHLSTSFRSWTPGQTRDLLWWLKDQYRWEVRQDMERRLGSLEATLSSSGHVVDAVSGLLGRLERAEAEARMDQGGSGALSRLGMAQALSGMGPPYAVAFADLDSLRSFNELEGNWRAGDQALAALVRILQGASPGAIVARQGGDEFYVVLPGLDGPQAVECLQRALDRCGTEVQVAGRAVTFAAGVSAVGVTAGHGALARAENAARAAARNLKDTGGRGRILFRPIEDAPA